MNRRVLSVPRARPNVLFTDSRVSVVFSSMTPEEGGIRAQGIVARPDNNADIFLKFSIFLTDKSF